MTTTTASCSTTSSKRGLETKSEDSLYYNKRKKHQLTRLEKTSIPRKYFEEDYFTGKSGRVFAIEQAVCPRVFQALKKEYISECWYILHKAGMLDNISEVSIGVWSLEEMIVYIPCDLTRAFGYEQELLGTMQKYTTFFSWFKHEGGQRIIPMKLRDVAYPPVPDNVFSGPTASREVCSAPEVIDLTAGDENAGSSLSSGSE